MLRLRAFGRFTLQLCVVARRNHRIGQLTSIIAAGLRVRDVAAELKRGLLLLLLAHLRFSTLVVFVAD